MCFLTKPKATVWLDIDFTKELKRIKYAVKKIRCQTSKVVFSKFEDDENLNIIGIDDALYKASEKSTRGIIILCSSSSDEKAVPFFEK